MINLSLRELQQCLHKKQISVAELASVYLDRCHQYNPILNALVHIDADIKPDYLLAAQVSQGPLAGIPIIHKDLFSTQGVTTTAGSKMLANYVPPFNATVVSQLNQAGMVQLAKANMDEFAMGSSNEYSAFGAVKNPWDLQRVPGGSSGGSAAAVAARLAPVATASDTGGSIRQPAALCGVTGIKPSYGRVSRYGMVAFASSLDQGGVMAVSADDCALVLTAMMGHDAKDSTSIAADKWTWQAPEDASMKGLKVGVIPDWLEQLEDQDIKQSTLAALDTLVAQGAELVDVDLPHADLAVAAYYILAPAEASANLARFDGIRFGQQSDGKSDDVNDMYRKNRSAGFGAEVQRRIMLGTWALSSGYYDDYYCRAQRIRRLISEDFKQAFSQVDVMAVPVSPEVAFKHGTKSDGVSMYQADQFTIPASLAGLPCLSMPIQPARNLPVGLQLIGPYFNEQVILTTAAKYQLVTDYHQHMPEAFL
ncbi:Asp-tRNA(Asn)/Glu-tRNA(Gln) amidotransferase subunit GatA [Marinicella gelatinilytica]|uniref:Asp-tRNA(Asn)/Glu-tRNA(Gln) amidotransferase subunit GatA n=1 Tax=Marinicella gelatinilytica TaxID=2996017 RepID=UPI002260FE81|nr:Asp-tRNA(Asn)/Glu-tRNA(Gln) amidotransferase subunit GatA [Marinicella gelatinilytica]MCX7545554.1 Asp-tRNA(Asn)/Glu-tRNA(Gln) amidotransferase subunit GatA [Marinicella gelatinilytica]